MSRVRCRACKAYVDKDSAVQINLGYVCDVDCLNAARHPTKVKRAGKNSIPPDIRKTVRTRDRNACRFCQVKRFVQLHHIRYRSEGGVHDERNLIALCADHHALVHTDKGYWQPVLLALVDDQYNTRRFMLVPQFERMLARTASERVSKSVILVNQKAG